MSDNETDGTDDTEIIDETDVKHAQKRRKNIHENTGFSHGLSAWSPRLHCFITLKHTPQN
jgi:hypothetical protein